MGLSLLPTGCQKLTEVDEDGKPQARGETMATEQLPALGVRSRNDTRSDPVMGPPRQSVPAGVRAFLSTDPGELERGSPSLLNDAL